MTGRRKATETSSKAKLPEVPVHVFDKRNNKQYKKGDFLGKVSNIECRLTTQLSAYLDLNDPNTNALHMPTRARPRPLVMSQFNRVDSQDASNLLIVTQKLPMPARSLPNHSSLGQAKNKKCYRKLIFIAQSNMNILLDFIPISRTQISSTLF